jgi:hypothetical protein
VLLRDREDVEGGCVNGIAALLDIQFFSNAAEEFGFMTYRREHAAQEQEIPCLNRRQIRAEGRDSGRKLDGRLCEAVTARNRLRVGPTYLRVAR